MMHHRIAWRLGRALLSVWALGGGTALAQAPAGGDVADRVTSLINEALPAGVPPKQEGRTLFAAVLDSPEFRHGRVGPLVVYAIAADDQVAANLVGDATRGLAPLRAIPGLLAADDAQGAGIQGRSQSIVLTKSKADYERVLALLDHCESLGFSGWKPDNAVWTVTNREAETARTWDVQVFNLEHPAIAGRVQDWLPHGLGYYTLAHLVNRAVRMNAWGLSPPWFDQGLIDELDIQAYGQSWVGGEAWEVVTEGWFRPGWSGFLPEGTEPPEQPSGPPKDLATKFIKTGDPWDDRTKSAERHWAELIEDRRSEAPASFAYMAEHQSFMPRDRAFARCGLHLVLALGQGDEAGPGLLTQLERTGVVSKDGMLDADPLTVIVSDALGGVPEVQRVEALPLSELLVEIQRPDIAARLTELEAQGLLALIDHREQSRWLFDQWKGRMVDRGEVFRLILEAEQCQQLYEWPLIGQYLDRGMAGVLFATPNFPVTDSDRATAVAAFRAGFTQEMQVPPPAPPAGEEAKSKKAPPKKKSGKADDKSGDKAGDGKPKS